MSSFQCLQNSRRALYRVFISPLERREASLHRQLLPLLHGRALFVPGLPVHQGRSFVTTPRRLRIRGEEIVPESQQEDLIDKRFTTKADIEKSGRDRPPQDHEITDPKIMVLDNGNFDGPLTTRYVLARLGEDQSLRMVQPYIPARPKDNVPAQFAICKIVNKKDEYERQRELKERRRVSRATAAKTKELELNWAISDNDLGTKLRQLSGFLSKGMKVEVIFGKKKRGKQVDEGTANELVGKVKKGAEELGAREHKPVDGQVGKTLRLYYEGTAK